MHGGTVPPGGWLHACLWRRHLQHRVYAARRGLAVAYGTALGDDPYSQAILDLARREGIAVDQVPRLQGRVPGLYVIETDDKGERRFFYWRGEAPARQLFELAESAPLLNSMREARCVYFSGITLSLFSPLGLDRFEAAVRRAREAGARIAFDGNYRPRGWGGDAARARSTMARFLALVDIALPTFDDEQALWDDRDVAATIARLRAHGVGEIAVKNGAEGAILASDGATTAIAVPDRVAPLDTTAAGDSFNAGYLAARLREGQPTEAVLLGHRLAGIVIRHRGAIVPKEAMADLNRG